MIFEIILLLAYSWVFGTLKHLLLLISLVLITKFLIKYLKQIVILFIQTGILLIMISCLYYSFKKNYLV
jgi:hypothetical protein